MASAFDAHAPAAGFRLRGAEKLAFVSAMFDRVAPTYDLLNHLISLGQTTLWRVLALSWLHELLPPNCQVLDVGCCDGTQERKRARIAGGEPTQQEPGKTVEPRFILSENVTWRDVNSATGKDVRRSMSRSSRVMVDVRKSALTISDMH